jgi:hypothetical protein
MCNKNLLYLVDGDFEQLHGAIKSFQNKYPLSLVNIDFKRYCREIERIGNARKTIAVPNISDKQSSTLVNTNQLMSPDSSTSNFSCNDSVLSATVNDTAIDTTSLQ